MKAFRLLLIGVVAFTANAFPNPFGDSISKEEQVELRKAAAKCMTGSDPMKGMIDLPPAQLLEMAKKLKAKKMEGISVEIQEAVTEKKNSLIVFKVDLAKISKGKSSGKSKAFWLLSGVRADSCSMRINLALMCAAIKKCKKYGDRQYCNDKLYIVIQGNPDGYAYNLEKYKAGKKERTTRNLQAKGNCDGIEIFQNFVEGHKTENCSGSAPLEAKESKFINDKVMMYKPCVILNMISDAQTLLLSPYASMKMKLQTMKLYRRTLTGFRGGSKLTDFKGGSVFRKLNTKTGTLMDTFIKKYPTKQFYLLGCKENQKRDYYDKVVYGILRIMSKQSRSIPADLADRKKVMRNIRSRKANESILTASEINDTVVSLTTGPKFKPGIITEQTEEGFVVQSQDYYPNGFNERGQGQPRPIMHIAGGGIWTLIGVGALGKECIPNIKMISYENPNRGASRLKTGTIDPDNMCANMNDGIFIHGNYPKGWQAESDVCSPNYSGTASLTSPEARNIYRLFNSTIESGKKCHSFLGIIQSENCTDKVFYSGTAPRKDLAKLHNDKLNLNFLTMAAAGESFGTFQENFKVCDQGAYLICVKPSSYVNLTNDEIGLAFVTMLRTVCKD